MPLAPRIRPAEVEDADFVAWAIQTASRSHVAKGWFDISLNLPEDQCLDFLRRLATAETRSWWHYSLFLIADVDGHAASALCRFRAGDGYPTSQQAMTEVARGHGWSDARLEAMWERGSYIFTCVVPGEDDCWTIENVATIPEYRGRGLTGVLIERALADGRNQGFTEAQVTFLIGNAAAERAYAKAGFHLNAERRHHEFEAACGSPGLRRYTRKV